MIWPQLFPADADTPAVREAAAHSSRRNPPAAHSSRRNPPAARSTDPVTSHLAAASVAAGVSALEAAILGMASTWQPWSAFDLAAAVEREQPGRWDEGTIRSRVSKLGQAGRLVNAPEKVKSPRGHDCEGWLLP